MRCSKPLRSIALSTNARLSAVNTVFSRRFIFAVIKCTLPCKRSSTLIAIDCQRKQTKRNKHRDVTLIPSQEVAQYPAINNIESSFHKSVFVLSDKHKKVASSTKTKVKNNMLNRITNIYRHVQISQYH